MASDDEEFNEMIKQSCGRVSEIRSALQHGEAFNVPPLQPGPIQRAGLVQASSVAGMLAKPCTCHPDDNPPVPCPRKYALHECIAAADPSNWRLGPLTYDGLHTHPQFDAEAIRRDIAVLADKIDALTATVGKILQMVAIKPPISAEQQAAAHKLYLHDEARAAMRAVDKVRR